MVVIRLISWGIGVGSFYIVVDDGARGALARVNTKAARAFVMHAVR